MKIEIKLFAALTAGRFKSDTREFENEVRVAQVIESLGFKDGEVGIILINGRHGSVTDSLNDSDTLSLLPLMDGG